MSDAMHVTVVKSVPNTDMGRWLHITLFKVPLSSETSKKDHQNLVESEEMFAFLNMVSSGHTSVGAVVSDVQMERKETTLIYK